ncbi:SOR/SNZ family-domain-containing protein [Lanmaoa asiatica]|nr:SOR/SNZ family-domain-containing protein [Lanmaoa asiatica]
MLKGGVIMDVVNAEQARIAEEAGACAVMALERVPADIRAEGGVSRMVNHTKPVVVRAPHFTLQSDPAMIKDIINAVSIPVMAKARIGHFVEAQILQAVGVDYIDESEVLTPADEEHHINKHSFKIPFVCGARNLGEALRRISEGAAFIRTKGEAGTGNVVEAVRHQRTVMSEIRKASVMNEEELYAYAKDIQAPFHLLKEAARLKRLPVVNFAAGGIATPGTYTTPTGIRVHLSSRNSGCSAYDAARLRRSLATQPREQKPSSKLYAVRISTRHYPLTPKPQVTHYNNAKVLAEISENLGAPMVGLTIDANIKGGRLAERGW